MIRFFDFVLSAVGIVILFPFGLLISLAIIFESKGGVFYRQIRVGQFGRPFRLFKFRTMYTGSDKKGLLTIGSRDSRVTRVGYFLRKYKLDELPQLMNVLKGEMSLVGPRPEVQKYVDLYSPIQREILKVKPGITDPASIQYKNENEIISKAANPEKSYVEEVLPHKITLSIEYAKSPSVTKYFSLIFQTLFQLFK